MTTVTPLSPSSPEYDKIAKYITASYQNACIIFIDTIQDHVNNASYEKRKASMASPNEKLLFHGTAETNIHSIIRSGYDPSCGKVMSYGRGIYFATSATYSKTYMRMKKEPSGHKISHMLVNKVLTGKSCSVGANQHIPPGYDSATNSLESPIMYVIDKPEQMIPQYHIGFYTGS